MAFQQPLVLERLLVSDFVNYVLHHHEGPSTLIVCGSKEAFLERLSSDTAHPASAEAPQPETAAQPAAARPWVSPTLRLLSTSSTVKVVFCPDITHLRAYLVTYTARHSHGTKPSPAVIASSPRYLAILNPIQLHRPTSAFSAQGLNRTFSAAVEAAYNSHCKLVVAECPCESDMLSPEDAMENGTPGQSGERTERTSPWDEDVSILNVTTKSFGSGERGWVGRTVKLRAIAWRWCAFEAFKSVNEG